MGAAHAQNIQGAIYTTDPTGTKVNGNNYASKLDVYLNGGPQHCVAPGLPPDDYYYMVTNPSGSVLLSLDPVADRKFRVTAGSNGKIAQNLGNTATHIDGSSPCAGGISIRLAKDVADFADTDNPGGVYKAWITRASDFDALCDGSKSCELDAFVHSNTKTDNFKVNGEALYDGALQAYKFYDANANGQYDPGTDLDLPGWQMTLTSVHQGVNSSKETESDGTATWDPLVPDSDYFVTEGTPVQGNWVHSTTIYVGHDGSPQNPAGPLAVTAGQTTTVAFGNYCTIPSNGLTLGFWSNRNGQALVGSSDLAMLVALNLRNANGTNFDPGNYAALKNWLLNATATNMAYMLSAQLATMELNVFNGIANGNAFYVPAGKTINQIMSDANTSLGLYGLTLSGHPQRANQEQLKIWLDALNNNAGVLSPTPCAYSF
jgi:type II secretory pathway component PulJ